MKPGVMNFIPAQGAFGMDSLIKAMLAAGAPVARFQISEYWLDIGQVEDYTKARDSFDRLFGQNEETQ
jgi:NDP-mannose synthase